MPVTFKPGPLEDEGIIAESGDWTGNASLLWRYRRGLTRALITAFLGSVVIAFTLPKRYDSMTRIMPPDQQGSGALMLAALAGRAGSLGGLGSLGNLFSAHSSTALFMDLLRSGTVTDRLVERFQLQHVYQKRYKVDAAKRLVHNTTISDDKRSGVITIVVRDRDPVRARDLAQAYLDELNKLVLRTSTSAAHQERVFIEARLQSVNQDLERAQLALGEFSSKNSTIDLKEQTRAMVDAGARVQGELVVEQAGLESLRQVYGDANVRVREVQARIGTLQHQLTKLSGSSTTVDESRGSAVSSADRAPELYPPLHDIPRLAVPYADLYRRVRVQETAFDLLTQQYELARIEEAKDVPVLSVIDPPGVPEKKAFPPRLLLTAALTMTVFTSACVLIVLRDRWTNLMPSDPRRQLIAEIASTLSVSNRAATNKGRDAA